MQNKDSTSQTMKMTPACLCGDSGSMERGWVVGQVLGVECQSATNFPDCDFCERGNHDNMSRRVREWNGAAGQCGQRSALCRAYVFQGLAEGF